MMSNISQPLQTEATITIKQLADRLRTTMPRVYGEAHFAKLCVELDRHLVANTSLKACGRLEPSQKEAIEILCRYATVLRLLGNKPQAFIVQLALIWLDGHGWGGMALLRLSELILETREAYR